MKNKIIIICLIMALLTTGCSVKTASDIENNSPMPTEQVTAHPTEKPVPEHTQQPTENKPQELDFSYIDEVTLEKPFDTLFINQWNLQDNTESFLMNGKSYDKGIGMYIDTDKILEKQACIDVVWSLEKKYNKISFDIGCEQSMNYDVVEKFGQFKIIINADDKVAWESDWQDYSYSESSEFLIGEDCERLVIQLKQRKGKEGTLKVVLGNFKLYKNE